MSAAAAEVRGPLSPRHEHILDAAEACFVRNGFHRSTMQDLARAAAMSPGNIYRYFESKEAVVLALAEREHQRAALLVADLERAGDRRGALMRIIERYFVDVTRETAILRVDLWSEATRNPTIAALVARSEAEGEVWFVATLAALATAPACDPAALYTAMNPLMKGLIVNRALVPDYDAAAAGARLRALIEAGLAGALPLTEPAR